MLFANVKIIKLRARINKTKMKKKKISEKSYEWRLSEPRVISKPNFYERKTFQKVR